MELRYAKKVVLGYSLLLFLVLLLPAAALGTTSDNKVFVGGGLTVHEIDLKATRMVNGQVVPVSDFEIEPEDVIQINKDQNLMVTLSTNDPDRIEKVKVIDVAGVTTELVRQGSTYSIQNLDIGTYILNVIVNTGEEQAGYETILVVLEPGTDSEEPTTIINRVKQWVIVSIQTVFVFPPPEDDECDEGSILDANGRCIPLCDESVLPEGEECFDDGDPTDPDPPVCTPDGPPCPPCPEGVEAGWCADEDEQQDTNDDEDVEFRCQALMRECGWEGEIPEEDPSAAKPLVPEEEPEEGEGSIEVDGSTDGEGIFRHHDIAPRG